MLEAAVIDTYSINCVDGVEIEYTDSGKIRYVRIDIDTHPFVVPILREHGLVNGSFTVPGTSVEDEFDEEDDSWLIPTEAVEVDCRNIKWSKSMLRAFDDMENGRYKIGDINNFWRTGEDTDV